MALGIRRLAAGLGLIVLAAAVLLISDLKNRKSAVAAASAAEAAATSSSGRPARIPNVALFQYASRPMLDETARGVIESLHAAGFRQGETIHITKFNAENDMPTANSVAKAILSGDFDMVITISTPCLQVMASANRDGKVTHVFCTVTDPYGAGVGISRENPSSHPAHLAGIGTFQPVREVLRIAKKCYPNLKKIGEVWNPAEACSSACTELARDECKKLGVELLEAQVENSAGVLEAAQSLAARGAEVLWIGGDNTVEMAVDSVVQAATKAKIPVAANTPAMIDHGVTIALGADYLEVGREAGRLAARILKGETNPATVRIDNVVPQQLALNLSRMPDLRQPWKIPQEYMDKAAILIEKNGKKTREGKRD